MAIDHQFSHEPIRRRHRCSDQFPWKRAKRWLASHAGKPLNQVFSGFLHQDWVPDRCKNEKMFRHLVDFQDDGFPGLYVDQHDIVQMRGKTKHVGTKPTPYEIGHVILSDYQHLSYENGIWFLVTVPERVQTVRWSLISDKWVMGSITVSAIPRKWYFDQPLSIRSKCHKKSLNAKELAHHGLKNTCH